MTGRWGRNRGGGDYPEKKLLGIEGSDLVSHGKTPLELIEMGIRRVALHRGLEGLEGLERIEKRN